MAFILKPRAYMDHWGRSRNFEDLSRGGLIRISGKRDLKFEGHICWAPASNMPLKKVFRITLGISSWSREHTSVPGLFGGLGSFVLKSQSSGLKARCWLRTGARNSGKKRSQLWRRNAARSQSQGCCASSPICLKVLGMLEHPEV